MIASVVGNLLEEKLAPEESLAVVAAPTPSPTDQRVALLVKGSPMGFIVWDLDFRVSEWNPAAERIFGWTAREAIGQHASFMVPESARPAVSNVLKTLFERKSGVRSTNENLTKSGETVFIEWYNAPLLNEEGEIICVASLCEDITDRVRAEQALARSEERLRLINEATGAGTWDWDLTEGSASLDARAQEMLGLNQATVRGEQVTTRVHPEDIDKAVQAYKRHVEEGQPFRVDVRVVQPDGTFRWIHAVGKAQFGISGQPQRMVGIFLDMHERKTAELDALKLSQDLDKRFRDRSRELELARDELEEMCYAISHDLRSPLRSIHGFSKAIETEYEELLDENAHGYLQRIQNASVRLGDLLDGLLSMVRVNRVEATPEHVDVSAMVQDVGAELRQADPSHPVELIVQPGMSATGDPRLLRLLWTNLLSNAWKFTQGKENAQVEVSDTGGTFAVKDNGVGFNMQYSDKLYKPFQKVHSPNQFPGTGIGLAIAHRIVARHGGTIWAEGREGDGATFYFRLTR